MVIYRNLTRFLSAFHQRSCKSVKETFRNCVTDVSSEPAVDHRLNSEEFRKIMSKVPSPVVVVTTVTVQNKKMIKRGITCSSFTSVSLQPPIISFCIRKPSRIQQILVESGHFAVHVLSDEQVNYSIFFSKPSIDGIDQFHSIPHTCGINEVPVINNVAAVLQCEGFQTHNVGDHDVWYGLVNDSSENTDRQPLLYYQRSFRNIGDRAFMDAFERAQLKFKDWTHEAHLRMAWNYVKEFGKDEAIPKIRDGIKHFNEQHKVKIKRGYHETVTRFYVHFVDLAIKNSPDCTTFEQFVLRNEYLFDKSLMLSYYSKEVLSSEEARKRFVEPDKQPFPT